MTAISLEPSLILDTTGPAGFICAAGMSPCGWIGSVRSTQAGRVARVWQGTETARRGPDGTSKSMLNGLADSVVKDTDNPEGAAAWAAFLGSAKCQQEVAKAGVVFPARRDSTPIAAEVYRSMGIDPAPFTAPVEEDNTFYVSVTTHAADVTALLGPALEDIWANRVPASTLNEANDSINVLFETGG